MSKLKASTIELVKEVEGNFLNANKSYNMLLGIEGILEVTFMNESRIAGVLHSKGTKDIKEFFLNEFRDLENGFGFTVGFEHENIIYYLNDIVRTNKNDRVIGQDRGTNSVRCRTTRTSAILRTR